MNMNRFLTVLSVLLAFTLGACAPTQPKQNNRDIYAALTDDQIQYRNEDGQGQGGNDNASPEFVKDQVAQVRTLYFQRKYDEAVELAERVMRLDNQQAEVYYWLSRIRMDQGDFDQAHELANKGLTVVYDKNLERELRRIQGITQMGSQ